MSWNLRLLLVTHLLLTSIAALPREPIFFHKLITDPNLFDDFLASNANMGRAELNFCTLITHLKPWTNSTSTSTQSPVTDPFTPTTEPSPVLELTFWTVGDCNNNFTVTSAVQRVAQSKAEKFLILQLNELHGNTWRGLLAVVRNRPFILVQWPVVAGPGPDSMVLEPLRLPTEDLRGLAGVVLAFLEGSASVDNYDDRYWYYHYDQMATHLDSAPLQVVPTKLVAFNGLYLTRSTAPDIGNCSRATGFLHYLNPRDTVRLNVNAYRRKIEMYGMRRRFNVWAISEFYSPNFKGTAGRVELRGGGVVIGGILLVIGR